MALSTSHELLVPIAVSGSELTGDGLFFPPEGRESVGAHPHVFFREYLPIPGEIQLFAGSLVCPLWRRQGKLAKDAVCLAEMRV